MASIFSKIINGEIPCYKIAEDNRFFAFLDIFPTAKGHVLVVPKAEVDYIFDLDSDQYMAMFEFAKKIAIAQKSALLVKRVGIVVAGFEVPHAHIHLIPMNTMNDMSFEKEKLKFSTEEFQEIAETIRKEIRF